MRAHSTITGRQRCLDTIAGKTPDRVPAYTPTIASDVASLILGRPAHTGGPGLWYAEAVAWSRGPAAWQEFDRQVVEDVIAIHRALNWEAIRLPWRKNIHPTRQLDDESFQYGEPDGRHEVWRWDRGSMNFSLTYASEPPTACETWPDLARNAEQTLPERIAAARATHNSDSAALASRVGDDMLTLGSGAGLSLGLDEQSLLAAILEPAAVETILDCNLAVGIAQLEACAARGLKVILGGGDMADKNGPIYSPEMFQRFMAPRWRKIAARCRELGLHYVWRSDGKLWKVSDILFRDIGFPGYGEVDYDASMTTAALKERYPELVIWANVSGDLLRRGTAEEVHAHCTGILRASGGSRHFHGCSNTILPGTPVANVQAMMQARDDFAAGE